MGTSQEKPYLVRGAVLRCSHGSHPRKLNLPECHGVYIDSNPLVNANDCIAQNGPEDSLEGKNITVFGACTSEENTYPVANYESEEGLKKGRECHPDIVGGWKECKDDVLVGDAPALTMDSHMTCRLKGEIRVETSGQEE